MKNIIVLSPETVPLSLLEGHPETIQEKGQSFSIYDKCTRTTAPGKRSWKFAEHLSNQNGFNVTLLIPELNFPPRDSIDTSNINFNLQPYNFKAANWDWSAELDRRLKQYDFVVIQSTTGTGFQNCSVLPKSVNVILDGWVPILAELPCVLLNNSRIQKKIFWQKKFINQYQDLLRRANCILYANERQHYYYEGQAFMIQKLDWSAFKFSPLLKVPYGIDKFKQIKRIKRDDGILKLVWYGPVYPWYAPEEILNVVKGRDDIQIDFVGIVHPRYKRVFNSYFKKFFDEVKNEKNINIVEDYCDDPEKLLANYDAGIIIARNWLEEKYSHRCRILDMISRGFPVIINEGNALYEELDFFKPMLHPVSTSNLLNDLIKIKDNKDVLDISTTDIDSAYDIMNWENVLAPVVDYIRRF